MHIDISRKRLFKVRSHFLGIVGRYPKQPSELKAKAWMQKGFTFTLVFICVQLVGAMD
jgi:hypothetical protein